MGSILNDADRTAICQRIGTVTSASVARWGRMEFPMKHFLLHVVPFPKGAPTAPELLVPDSAPVDAIRSALVTLVRRIGEGPREGYGPTHPLFGRLSFREWGVATHKHTDHHLRQFGA